MSVIKITQEQKDKIDLDILREVLGKARGDVDKRLRLVRDDHRFVQGQMLILDEISDILN